MISKPIAFILLILGAVARGQTSPAAPGLLDFGLDEAAIPQPRAQNVTSPRTVQLLSEAAHVEPGAARAQLIRDLGACKLSAGLDAVRFAMTDADPMVRAEAARAAGMIGDRAIVSALHTLLRDPDATVRREAVLAGSVLKEEQIVAECLKDQDAAVAAAAFASASTK